MCTAPAVDSRAAPTGWGQPLRGSSADHRLHCPGGHAPQSPRWPAGGHAGQPCRVAHMTTAQPPPPPLKIAPETRTAAPCPDRPMAGALAPKGAMGARALGVQGGAHPLPRSAPRRGPVGRGEAEARSAPLPFSDPPAGGLILVSTREAANDIAQQCVVSPLSCKVAARALPLAA